MPADDFADTTGELEVSIVGLAGVRADDLAVAITIARRGDALDDVETVITGGQPLGTTRLARYHEWIVDLASDAAGTRYALGPSGVLYVGDRRYPLPAPRGLTSLWVASPDELLACGPGSLAQVRLDPGRIRVDVLDDDGPGEAVRVAGWGSASTGAIAVGTAGALWRKDDDGWTAHETPARETLTDLAWVAAARAFVVGTDGGVYTWDGGALALHSRHDRAWRACAWYQGALYLAAATGGVVRLDGSSVEPVSPLPLRRLRVVGGELLAWGGALLARFDGATWSGGPLELP